MSRPNRLFPGRVVVGGFVVGSASRQPGKEVWRVLCGFHPPRTVSSGAIRDDSRSSTRVPWLFLHVSHGCVCTTIVEANPRDGGSFSCTISLLNSVSFPYETHSASTYVSPSPPLAMIRLYFFVPFYEARCSRLWRIRLLLLYAIMYRFLWLGSYYSSTLCGNTL